MRHTGEDTIKKQGGVIHPVLSVTGTVIDLISDLPVSAFRRSV